MILSVIVRSVESEPSNRKCVPISTVLTVSAALLVSVVSASSLIVLFSSKVMPSRFSVPPASRTPPVTDVPPDKSRALLLSLSVVVLLVMKVAYLW